ncbi:unnamed protein product [Oppiella nova]|uniref:EF-hand domain-containing protein n=1 Tax=Oppiella nova TaxID=334625 RepID=A0A7R9QJU6_9ACAR|nr:unnamed protein product [Oppiella nova]CAG2166745.1 unnamed protein product [Oppiella nova]
MPNEDFGAIVGFGLEFMDTTDQMFCILTANPDISIGKGLSFFHNVFHASTLPFLTSGLSTRSPPTRPTGQTDTRLVSRISANIFRSYVLSSSAKYTTPFLSIMATLLRIHSMPAFLCSTPLGLSQFGSVVFSLNCGGLLVESNDEEHEDPMEFYRIRERFRTQVRWNDKFDEDSKAIDKLLEEYDRDNDGFISYSEYIIARRQKH